MNENVNIPDSNITANLTFRNLVLMNMQALTNFPYIENDFDALTDYELLSLVVKFLNDVIANQNEQNDSITNLYNSFLALQTYVNNTKDTLEDAFNTLDNYVRNYFANLDVQEEIDHKLDEMAESGQLTDIIAQYLGLAGMIVFDTVSDMKLAENLVNGSKCQTLGYYSINDKGNSIYKIRTKTNEDVTDEGSLVALYDNNLVAELIIDDSTTVNSFGAYGDNTHDDYLAFTKMITKTGTIKTNNQTYLISDTLTINFDCSIDGTLHYTGNDFAIEMTNMSHKKILINNIQSDAGGIIFRPSDGNFVSFIDLYLKYSICTNEVIKCDATNGIVTLVKLDGIRWRASTNGLILLNIDETHANNTFLTEINVHNIDMWTQNSLKGIVATNSASDVEIQFNLYNVNFENCKGISTTGKISMIGIYDCRMPEIVSQSGWLTFNNYLPMVNLQGNGYLYPEKITINGVTNSKTGSNNYIQTNMTIIDYTTTYNYEGGGILYYDYFKPYIEKQVWKDLSSSIDNHNVSYSPNKNGNIYNWFTITSESWVQFTIPVQRKLPKCYIRVTNTIGLTLTNGNASTTISDANGLYEITQIGNGIWYNKLSI